nr:uncharacterized protein LOC113708058 [Coffea arabica]
METAASIKPHHHAYKIGGFRLNSPNSNTKDLVPNGIDNNNNNSCCCCCCNITADIEMITLQAAAAYTSLKDLMPTSPRSPNAPAIACPATACRKDSLRDIPINLKDPLLQHAAWAYLQPAMTPHDHRAHACSFLQNLKHHCSGVFGCFNDVLLVLLNSWFPANDSIRTRRRRRRGGPDDDDEEKQEEDQENAAAPAGGDASSKKTTATTRLAGVH